MASLVLRASLTITLTRLSISLDTNSASLSVIAAILGCLIGLGFLTRGAAVATALLMAFGISDEPIALLPIISGACAVALIGAGAYSIDRAAFHKRLYNPGN